MEIIFNFIIKLGVQFINGHHHRSLGYFWGLFIRAGQLFLFIRFLASGGHCDSISGAQATSQLFSETRFFIGVLTQKGLHMAPIFDLGPHKVDVDHFVFIILNPPVPVFE
jgi:hypothetical protein